MMFKIRQYKWTAVSMEDTALKTAVAAAVKAALVPVNAELARVSEQLARVSEQLALVVSDNAELKEHVKKLEEDICAFAPDKIRNVSAQVSLFFCGDQPVPEEMLEQRKKHFQEMDEDKFFDFHTALEGEKDHTMRKLTANQWQVKFDNILDGRNGTIRFQVGIPFVQLSWKLVVCFSDIQRLETISKMKSG